MKESFSEPDDPIGFIHWSWHATLLATALGRAGQFDEAIEFLDKARTYAETDNERWAEAEIWRVRGDLAGFNANNLETESHFNRAIKIARAQHAKSWELRAATSLARLWQSLGRTAEARDLLTPVYSWFTEGFNTADLEDAKALLDELS